MNRTLIYSCFLIILFSACKTKKNCDFNTEIRKQNDSIIASLESDPEDSAWWKNYLYRIDEPSLKTEKQESYRLMIHNSMSKSSEIYRIYNKNGSYEFVSKKLERRENGNKKDTVLQLTKRDLTENQWNEFKSLTERTKLWNLLVAIERSGLDGQNWVIEAQMPNKENCTEREYHVVVRWQPIDTTEFMRLSRKLIELGK
ncbi:MAG: hypothetical protein CL528_07725 [Aequorivita sp.]|nr:hypothetical protein [Aequorivita sp.]MBP41646.1 hypothetical protein [Aequorivita sp.]HBC04033.1 hypothetical protein [Aequorivita sp.]|tara:strand:- start:52 stop:651 length:600 start_codon:yes stop_codon:yes gene_type:complete